MKEVINVFSTHATDILLEENGEVISRQPGGCPSSMIHTANECVNLPSVHKAQEIIDNFLLLGF